MDMPETAMEKQLKHGSKMPGSINAVLVKSPLKRCEYLPLQITGYGFMDETLNYISKDTLDLDT